MLETDMVTLFKALDEQLWLSATVNDARFVAVCLCRTNA